MLMGITDESWTTAQQVFAASCSRPEAKGTNDRRVLEALHYFRVHSITLRALPRFFGNWNSVWKRLWRLSRVGVLEACFEALAALRETARVV
jgi:transposase